MWRICRFAVPVCWSFPVGVGLRLRFEQACWKPRHVFRIGSAQSSVTARRCWKRRRRGRIHLEHQEKGQTTLKIEFTRLGRDMQVKRHKLDTYRVLRWCITPPRITPSAADGLPSLISLTLELGLSWRTSFKHDSGLSSGKPIANESIDPQSLHTGSTRSG